MSNFFRVTGLPLRINQSSYQITENDSYIIVETQSTLVLPPNPKDSKAVLIVNVSNNIIELLTNGLTNKIYNNLYSPEGSYEIKMEANRIIYLIFIMNYSTNQGHWVSHFG